MTKHSNVKTKRDFGVAGMAVWWTRIWDNPVEVADGRIYLQSFAFGE